MIKLVQCSKVLVVMLYLVLVKRYCSLSVSVSVYLY